MADLVALNVAEAGQVDLQGGAAEATLPRAPMALGVGALARPSVRVHLAEAALEAVLTIQVAVAVAAAQ